MRSNVAVLPAEDAGSATPGARGHCRPRPTPSALRACAGSTASPRPRRAVAALTAGRDGGADFRGAWGSRLDRARQVRASSRHRTRTPPRPTFTPGAKRWTPVPKAGSLTATRRYSSQRGTSLILTMPWVFQFGNVSGKWMPSPTEWSRYRPVNRGGRRQAPPHRSWRSAGVIPRRGDEMNGGGDPVAEVAVLCPGRVRSVFVSARMWRRVRRRAAQKVR